MVDLIKQEVAKLIRGTRFGKEGSVDFIHTNDFSFMASNLEHTKGITGSWIIDTGASNHICVNHDFLMI